MTKCCNCFSGRSTTHHPATELTTTDVGASNDLEANNYQLMQGRSCCKIPRCACLCFSPCCYKATSMGSLLLGLLAISTACAKMYSIESIRNSKPLGPLPDMASPFLAIGGVALVSLAICSWYKCRSPHQ